MRAFLIAMALLLTATQAWATYPKAPNPQVTTGVICSPEDPDYVGRRYPEKIAFCQRNVSNDLKDMIYSTYNIPRQCRHRYTVDHFIPLSIGGDNQAANLWPEHLLVKASRKDLEQQVFDSVSTGQMAQKDAIELIRKEKMNPHLDLMWIPDGSGCD